MPVFDQLELSTSRLRLRALYVADAAALFVIYSDVRVMRYWSTSAWLTLEPAHALIARDCEAMASGKYLSLGIERKQDAQLIGTCTLFSLAPQCRRAEIGYALAHAAWGQGYMDEALTALLDFGFAQMDLNRVEADIDPHNVASAKSLQRLGFRHEGNLRERWIVDGQVSDSGMYALLRREWLARVQPAVV